MRGLAAALWRRLRGLRGLLTVLALLAVLAGVAALVGVIGRAHAAALAAAAAARVPVVPPVEYADDRAHTLHPRAACRGAPGTALRARACTLTDACIDPVRGLFLPHRPRDSSGGGSASVQEAARANLASADPVADQLWAAPWFALPPGATVRRLSGCTLYVQSAYAPYHLTHFLYNTALPAIEARLAFETRTMDETASASASAPAARCAVWLIADMLVDGKPPMDTAWLNFTAVVPAELRDHTDVLDGLAGHSWPVATRVVVPNEPLPGPWRPAGGGPTCFPTAIVGARNTCTLAYCAHRPSAAAYAEARRLAFAYAADLLAASPGPSAALPSASVSGGGNGAGDLVVLVQREHTRRVVNHADLLAALVDAGLNVISVMLEGMTFVEQVDLFRRASVVVAPHGNANGNILWMAPGRSALVEIFAYEVYNEFFLEIGRELGVRRTFWRCTDTSCIAPGQENMVTGQFFRDVVAHIEPVVAAVLDAVAYIRNQED